MLVPRTRRSAVKLGARLAATFLLFVPLAATPAAAVFGTPDTVPAATLLLPYFEVDLAERDGAATTLLSVQNVAGVEVVAHATVWTDLGLPTVNFNVVLTPFDAQVIDLRELFVEGSLPFEGFGDSCEDGNRSQLSRDDLEALQLAHTGRGSAFFSQRCGAVDHGDDVARGFVTIDVVNECTTSTPADEGYFVGGGNGVASNLNALWGEYTLSRGRPDFAQGEPMVHLETGGVLLRGVSVDSFYRSFVGGSGADNREALPRRWATGFFNGLTDVVCWRDEFGQPFTCETSLEPRGTLGPPVRLFAFDHAENPLQIDEAANPCAASASRFRVGGPPLPLSSKTGWLFLSTILGTGSELVTRGFQLHVTTLHTLHPGGLSAGMEATAVDDDAFDPGAILATGEP